MYTIAGVTCVVTAAGVVYYMNESSKGVEGGESPTTSKSKKKSKSQRKKAKAEAEKTKEAEPEKGTLRDKLIIR